MPFISKITLPSGSVYDIKDAQARSDISELQAALTGKVALIGETTTALADQATTNPIKINNVDTTAVAGNIVYYNRSEYLFDGTKWILLGDLSALGDLAYKDTASTTYTPAGTVSKPTFTGSESSVAITAADDANGNYEPKGTVSTPSFTGSSLTSTGKYTPSGSVSFNNTNQTAEVSKAASGTATYTPEGTVAAPTISVKTAGSTTTVNSITGVGTLPALGATVADENLTLTWDAGTLPTKGADTSVKTSDAAYQASAPSFTGTGARLVTGNISVPTSATFSGAEGDVSVTGTPSGTISQPTFTGTKAQISGTTTAAGTVSQPTFNGTQANIEVS